MKYVFESVVKFDQKCYDKFLLSEDILMEHAANEMASYIKANFENNKKILIVCGSGNNGADGIALGRILHLDYCVKVLLVKYPKTTIGHLQLERAKAVGVEFLEQFEEADIIVDCILGSGQKGVLDTTMENLVNKMNFSAGFKIACDIPTGLGISKNPFCANVTITMGGLKQILFEDDSKDLVGKIIVANLGLSEKIYQEKSNIQLLEAVDIKLPIRTKKNSHKGDYGHLCVIAGEKKGAAILSANSAINFGVGLVSLVSHEAFEVSPILMTSHFIPKNTTAICLGMGLGLDFEDSEIDAILAFDCKKVIDADMFYNSKILTILNSDVVLTPHPKEFASLLKITDLALVNHETVSKNRFFYANLFAKKFPNCVLVLKGSNTLICQGDQIWINPFGSQALAKGGSGDILAGLIGALLAQKYTSIDAAINGSLALSLASMKYDKNNYSMTPMDLIHLIKEL